MLAFIVDFFKFTGLNSNLKWAKDPFFYMTLFLSLPVKMIIVLLNPFSRPFSFLFLIYLLIPAFSEELFFRGLLIPIFSASLKGKIWFISYSNIVVSIIFSISHIFTHNIFWSTLVFFPSLVYGYFREKHNNIFPSIVLHFIYNFIYFY